MVAREVAREVGVTPAALYRHFEDIDQLRAEVSQAARERLAQMMISERDAAPASRDAKVRGRRRLAATGRAYVQFAIDEPGWFRAAFADDCALPTRPDDPSAWDVLTGVLDELVDAGALEPSLRESAPIIAWTSVHGLASLLVAGSTPPDIDSDALIQSVIAATHRALGIA